MAAKRGSDQNENAVEEAEIVDAEVENSADEVAEVYNPDEDAFEAEAEAEAAAEAEAEAEAAAAAAAAAPAPAAADADAHAPAPEDDPVVEETTTAEPAASPPPPKAGGMTTLLGGVLAAALGFVVAQIVPNGWPITADSTVTDALATADGEIRDVLDRKAD
ncbi:MAG: hypothetical protein MK180_07015, partial [Rhodobacteraceae bacterium]|nr:hypothetical protein [Paracoccaceae bacterium]